MDRDLPSALLRLPCMTPLAVLEAEGEHVPALDELGLAGLVRTPELWEEADRPPYLP